MVLSVGEPEAAPFDPAERVELREERVAAVAGVTERTVTGHRLDRTAGAIDAPNAGLGGDQEFRSRGIGGDGDEPDREIGREPRVGDGRAATGDGIDDAGHGIDAPDPTAARVVIEHVNVARVIDVELPHAGERGQDGQPTVAAGARDRCDDAGQRVDAPHAVVAGVGNVDIAGRVDGSALR